MADRSKPVAAKPGEGKGRSFARLMQLINKQPYKSRHGPTDGSMKRSGDFLRQVRQQKGGYPKPEAAAYVPNEGKTSYKGPELKRQVASPTTATALAQMIGGDDNDLQVVNDNTLGILNDTIDAQFYATTGDFCGTGRKSKETFLYGEPIIAIDGQADYGDKALGDTGPHSIVVTKIAGARQRMKYADDQINQLIQNGMKRELDASSQSSDHNEGQNRLAFLRKKSKPKKMKQVYKLETTTIDQPITPSQAGRVFRLLGLYKSKQTSNRRMKLNEATGTVEGESTFTAKVVSSGSNTQVGCIVGNYADNVGNYCGHARELDSIGFLFKKNHSFGIKHSISSQNLSPLDIFGWSSPCDRRPILETDNFEMTRLKKLPPYMTFDQFLMMHGDGEGPLDFMSIEANRMLAVKTNQTNGKTYNPVAINGSEGVILAQRDRMGSNFASGFYDRDAVFDKPTKTIWFRYVYRRGYFMQLGVIGNKVKTAMNYDTQSYYDAQSDIGGTTAIAHTNRNRVSICVILRG